MKVTDFIVSPLYDKGPGLLLSMNVFPLKRVDVWTCTRVRPVRTNRLITVNGPMLSQRGSMSDTATRFTVVQHVPLVQALPAARPL